LDLLRPLGAKKHVALCLENGQTRPVEIDANQFEQVVTNLVVNAIHAMDHEGDVTVRISEERISPPADIQGDAREFACVRVTDRGAGIEAEHVQHIFEPFFTTKDVGEGTGLGLSVAYGIVRDHGGWIAVKSEVGKGTEFAVYLPHERAS
jgi:signal transduction histidine kinase